MGVTARATGLEEFARDDVMTCLAEFTEWASSIGVPLPPNLYADKKVHKSAADPKDKKKSIRYCIFPDGAAWAQDMRRHSEPQYWRPSGRKATAAERKQNAADAKANRRKQETEKGTGQAKAAELAQRRWNAASAADGTNPYLSRKGVKAHGLRADARGCLLVPLLDDGKIVNLQTISPDGLKLFLKGGRVKGLAHIIGEWEHSNTIIVVEGYTTGATLYETTGHPCAVAFGKDNLLAVAQRLRLSSPDAEIIVAADNDWRKEGNPGLTKARVAASAVGARLAVPDFGNDDGADCSDFNDMCRLVGAEAVRECIAAAMGAQKSILTAGQREAIRKKYRFHGDPAPPLGPAIIKGMLPCYGTGLGIGQSGAGKTFIMIDLAVAVASGSNFFGRPIKTRAGVCIIAAEGAGEFNRRIDACTQFRGVSEILPFSYLPFSGDLKNDAEFEQLLSELPLIDAMFREDHGVPLGLVILDTISATFAMESQNDAAEVTAVCKRLKQIGERVKVFAFGVHHVGKDNSRDAAGSFAWRANVDVMWSALATGDRVRGIVKRLEFCVAKYRDGREGSISDYELVEVKLGLDQDGEPIESLAVQAVEAKLPRGAPKPMNSNEKAFAEAFNECAIVAPIKHRANGGGPEVIAVDAEGHRGVFLKRYPGEHGAAKKALNRARKELYKAGKYVSENTATHSLIWRAPL